MRPIAIFVGALCAGLGCSHHAAVSPTHDAGGAGAGPPPAESGAAGAALDAGTDATLSDAGMAVGFDPGFVGMRLLSNVEYANTLRDLFDLAGFGEQILASLPLKASNVDFFDNGPGASIESARYAAYFATTGDIVGRAFSSDPLRARVVTCAPASAADDTCATAIVRAFGLRAWRRPLTDDEVAGLVAVVRADLTSGDDFSGAIQQAVTAMLSSESFLYRIELDPPPPDGTVHPLTSYELASRLSYLLWSTMPDDTLFSLAASDELSKSDVLAAQVTRMLADPRSDGFARDFFGQWLWFRDATGGAVPIGTLTPSLQTAAFDEARLYVNALAQSDDPIGGLLTNDVNFVDADLAALYGFNPPPPAGTSTRVENTGDARAGFLGLASFLASASDSQTRTSPTIRGRWILINLLCEDVPNPPPNEPPEPTTGTTRTAVNDRLANPDCASCHSSFDPIGLGLEQFDQTGKLRLTYADGTPVDDHGSLGATPFEGEIALGQLVAKDPRFAACARRKLLTYALGRLPTDGDAARVAAIDAAWSAGGGSVRGLVSALVVDQLFRYRRGEGLP
jgi:hypothetical protein